MTTNFVQPTEVLYEQADGIAYITLNRPEARNALSFGLWEQFLAALDKIERDTPPCAVIVSGAGGFFSAGGDVKTPPLRGDGAIAWSARLELAQRVINRLRALPALTIAAVEGRAIGLGWALAMACDIIVAAEDSSYTAPFLNLGLVPDGGSAWFLTQRIGRHRAAEIILSCRQLSAAEAYGMGLVSQLVPAGTTKDRATKLIFAAGRENRHALELTKRMLHQAEEGSLTSVHALELASLQICQTSGRPAAARTALAGAQASCLR